MKLILFFIFVFVAGWFTVVSNNSGAGSARVYKKVSALVKAGVPAFLLAKPLRAYTPTHSKMGELQCAQCVFKIQYAPPHFVSILYIRSITNANI